ncbi:MAG: phosphoribosylamine--glycine ligase [Deltaproteobacteria bacterium]|nr:phosphoribosylamine--glycine ligase [Deltaproteobacteria bacterium]
MRVLVVGSGGREHALTWKICRSERVESVICAPGNAGMAAEPRASCVPAPDDARGFLDLVRQARVDLVVIGPEAPLVAGLADRLREAGIAAVGPSAEAAQLEGSKVFAKRFMQRCRIPTAAFEVFDSAAAARDFVRANPAAWVVKADGLAAGKGVLLCRDSTEAEQAIAQLMEERAFGGAGSRVVVEAFLEGEEASCIALCDGSEIRVLASSQDHKRALEGDRGPNTGGMGAYSPAPVLDARREQEVVERVFRPLVAGMAEAGSPFQGVIYAGLMIGDAGMSVLEFNVRFGDPETQALLPRLRSDLVPALAAVAGLEGRLADVPIEWDPRAAVCVVMASEGYPGAYEKDRPIEGLDEAARHEDVVVFHAGTRLHAGRVLSAGGRVLGVTALGDGIGQALERAYAAADEIHFQGAWFRRDIAHRALAR